MSKKMCGLFVVPLLLACVLSSCGKKEPPPEAPKPESKPAGGGMPVATFDFFEPPELTKKNHCIEVRGPVGDEKGDYHYCYYPYSRKLVDTSNPNRARCSVDVADCKGESGWCSKDPGKEKPETKFC